MISDTYEQPVGHEFALLKPPTLTVVEGIDQAVAAFVGLFRGRNAGKMVVKLG